MSAGGSCWPWRSTARAAQGDALRTLHTARRVLAEELGIDPGPALLALERAVLDQSPDLRGPEAPPEVGTWCPWPGLLAYGIQDAVGFFGRASRSTTASNGWLATGWWWSSVHPAAASRRWCGPASQARLQRHGQQVSIVVPGGRPVDACERPPTPLNSRCWSSINAKRSSPSATTRRSAPSSSMRSSRVLALARSSSPCMLDHLADLSGHTEFAALIERGPSLLGPMGETELRAAVEGPAGRAGLRLEPGRGRPRGPGGPGRAGHASAPLHTCLPPDVDPHARVAR